MNTNLTDMLTYGERINSQLKVSIGIIDKCGVRGDATLCVVIFDFGSQNQISRSFWPILGGNATLQSFCVLTTALWSFCGLKVMYQQIFWGMYT